MILMLLSGAYFLSCSSEKDLDPVPDPVYENILDDPDFAKDVEGTWIVESISYRPGEGYVVFDYCEPYDPKDDYMKSHDLAIDIALAKLTLKSNNPLMGCSVRV